MTALAIFDSAERCDYCATFYFVREGGPAAAIDKAVHYLDAYHQEDRLQKVQTVVRRAAVG